MAPGFLVSRFVLITLILFQGMFYDFLSSCLAKIMSKAIVEECDICCTFLYLLIFKNKVKGKWSTDVQARGGHQLIVFRNLSD